jgi:hypothetical protein
MVTEEQKDDPKTIRCIGIDNLQHICYPWEDKCLCGVQILRKKLLKNDFELYSCYECTF